MTGLNKQKIAIPLAQGINTKVDDKQLQIGSLEKLENAIFDEPGKIKKRTGYNKVNIDLVDNSRISNTQRITDFKDELCVFSNTNFYSYSESTDRWTNKGTVSNIFPTSKSIIRNTYAQSNIDSIHIDGIDVYTWEDGRGGVRVSIIDNATGNELLSDTEITATGSNPKVEQIGNKAYFFYIDGTDIKYRTVNPIRPSTIDAEISIVSADLHASNKIYDTTTIEDRIFISWNSAAATLKFITLQAGGVISSEQEEVAESPSVCISLNSDQSSRLLISYYNGTEVKVAVRSFSLAASLLTPTVIETISNITNTSIGTADDTNYTIHYEQSAAETYNHLIRQNTVNLAASVGTASTFLKSAALLSRSFVNGNSLYISVIHSSTLQSTVFVVNSDAEIVSRITPAISGDVITNGNLTKASAIDENKFLLSTQIKGRTVSENNTLFSVLGVNSSILDFDSDVKFDNAVLGENLHTTGGMVQSYDGKEIVEHGFHLYPENLTAGTNASSGGFMSDGTYIYTAVYSWTDNKGVQHKSATSVGLPVTLSAGGTVQTQTINVPTIRITEKSNVVIELYRTEAGGTLSYLITSPTSPIYNNKTVDSIAITDTRSDTFILSNELIYTTGGVLDNIAPPAASIIETFGNRIFLAGLEDDNQLQYSKIRQEGRPVEFNDTLLINVNARGGKIKAIATMEDKLIIFKETAIFYLSGDGPNNLGQQNNFIEPELITNDVGCETQNSIVLTPQGLMFKSKKGIYLLSRSLQTQYIGAAVEDFNDLTITDATIVTSKNQVVFLTNGDSLVYDYFVGKWTTYTNHKGISATTLSNTYYYVRSNNEVYMQADHFTDAGSFIKLRFETSWLSFAGIQAYQRIYRMLILGDYKSAHKLNVKVLYNFSDAIIQDKVIDTADFTGDTEYGGDSPYGTGSPYGGVANKYQIRVNFSKQKCESIKVQIEDSQSSSFGEGLQLSNLLFVVGVKRSEFKVSQSTTYGA